MGYKKDFDYTEEYKDTRKKRVVNNPTLKTAGHGLLDIAGMVPGLGAGADLANAAWYTAEGDLPNAAFSSAAAMPVAGLMATPGKYISKAWKAFKGGGNVSDITKIGKNAGDFTLSGKTFQHTGPSGEIRDITTVGVRGSDGAITHQPFYKSTGTSGPNSSWRKDRWMPFAGNIGGKFHKGRFQLSGQPTSYMNTKGRSAGSSLEDFNNRFGGDYDTMTEGGKRILKMSDELGTGKFTQTGKGNSFGEMGDWIGKDNTGNVVY